MIGLACRSRPQNILPNSIQNRASLFRPQLARVLPSSIQYPRTHILGVPQEIRDVILWHCDDYNDTPNNGVEQLICAHPTTVYEIFQLVCRQAYHEISGRFTQRDRVLVPHRRLEQFIAGALNTTTLNSNAYRNIRSIYIELPHNYPTDIFVQVAEILKLSTALEELRIFGVGPDKFGVSTSSTAHSCGKHDVSIMSPVQGLSVAGQEFDRRLVVANSLPWLHNLRVLVLDNLNLPLLEAHVLKNHPRLEKLHIAADARSILHPQYRTRRDRVGLGNLIFPVHDMLPALKALHIDSNAIFTASNIVAKVAPSLEKLEWVIPEDRYQEYMRKVNFFGEASQLLQRLPINATQLRVLKICVHSIIYDVCPQSAGFIGALKDCVSRMKSLQVVELHLNPESPWIAREFIGAIPPSVKRLYLSDSFVHGDVRDLTGFIGEKTKTPLKYANDEHDQILIGEDPCRKDSITFNRSHLGFVGYEYECFQSEGAARRQEADIIALLKMNARLLDKERNRHLAKLQGKHIRFQETIADRYVEKPDYAYDRGGAPSHDEVVANGKELASCGLSDAHPYFGFEDVAEVVFYNEPVAKDTDYTSPAVIDVGSELKFASHWLSK